MFINRLQLTNFKRFTDLLIDLTGLATPPKLVLLIGSNGSGKSSVFDAFEVIADLEDRPPFDKYYKKREKESVEIRVGMTNGYTLYRIDSESGFKHYENQYGSNPYSFYGRSSLRQIPRLTRTGFSQKAFNFGKDTDRPRFYIDREERFENDIEHIIKLILDDVFRNNAKNSQDIINSYITPINKAFENIFGLNTQTSLRLYSFTPPVEGNTAEILFQKGDILVHYDLLSSGEKEIFNILFNLLSRRSYYQDTIYFMDQLDVHLNTKLQYNLLKEITENWLPDNCQLWTASHSLGFIDYANDTDHSAIVDFDDLNFDLPQMLYPKPKDKLEVYEVAVPKEMLLKLFQGKNIIVCENQNDEYYNLLGIEDAIFVGVKDCRQLFLTIKREKSYTGLRDRDFLTDSEISRIRKHFPNLFILHYYCFENYLYHPDNIAEVNPPGFDKQLYMNEILQQKQQRLNYILPDIKMSRQNYEELKEEGVKDKSIDKLIDDLQSDDFETFYKYFDMKEKFNKKSIELLSIPKKALVQTNWFKQQIVQILTSTT